MLSHRSAKVKLRISVTTFGLILQFLGNLVTVYGFGKILNPLAQILKAFAQILIDSQCQILNK